MNPPSLLVIDDDEDVRAVVQLTFEHLSDYRVHLARDGSEGIELCKQLRPDVVLLDYMMPDMDGLACLDALTQQMQDDLPAVFLLTARQPPEGVARDQRPNLVGVIAKPFHPVQLVARVREVGR